MRLSKQHKMYGAVLGLALAALGADRLLFSGPALADEASAAAAVEPVRQPARSATIAKTVVVAPATDATAGDRRAIAARLDDLAQTAGADLAAVNDAFAPSTAWVKVAEPDNKVSTAADAAAVAAALAAAKAEEMERARRFAQEHKLTAVMGDGRHGVAVIDGHTMRPGQTLKSGLTLVSVSTRKNDLKATFEFNGVQFDLRLQDATPAAATVAQAN